MYAVATSRPSIFSIIHDSMRPSVDTVGDGISYLYSQSHFSLPSAHPLPLILTSSLFSFRNTRYDRLLSKLLTNEVLGFLRFDKTEITELLWFFPYFSLEFLYKYIESLLDAVLIKDDIFGLSDHSD